MFKGIDLSSDTATKPTAKMKQAMIEADLGDEQKGEDPTTRKLEEMIAQMLKFNSAMFFPSATMANEIALLALCERGDELLAAGNSHFFFAEAGGPAVHANVMCKPIYTKTGIFTAEDVKQHYCTLRGAHYPVSRLLSVENTANMGGGIAWSHVQLTQIVQCAKQLNLKLHMDGARFFNASVKTGLLPHQISAGFDMVTICLSKGLGCPVGALLAFDSAHYEKIRRLKQLMGGAMRQSGMLAAAGIYALTHHITRLEQDHQHAEILAQKLSENTKWIRLMNYPVPTNMVFFEWTSDKMTSEQFLAQCLEKGVRFSRAGLNCFRAVTHLDINREQIDSAAKIVKEICSQA